MYHHGVKGTGTQHFSLPTLIAAQCKLFDVLYARTVVDGCDFYAAVGGICDVQPPTALTGCMGARKKTRAHNSKHSPPTGGGERRQRGSTMRR